MKNPSDKYSIVLIEWADAYGSSEWLDEEEVDENHLIKERCLAFSIGWLIRKNKNIYVISSMCDVANNRWGQVQTIPRGWAEIKVLAPPKKKR